MTLFTTSFFGRAAALASLVLLGGCTKKNDDPAPAAPTEFSWTVDNTTYTATTATATIQGTKMSLDGTVLAGGSSTGISLSVPAMVGTYNTVGASNTVNYSMFYFSSLGNTNVLYMASNGGSIGSGVVTVTTFSATNIVGTFSFTGSTITGTTSAGGLTKVITNGKFNIKR